MDRLILSLGVDGWEKQGLCWCTWGRPFGIIWHSVAPGIPVYRLTSLEAAIVIVEELDFHQPDTVIAQVSQASLTQV